MNMIIIITVDVHISGLGIVVDNSPNTKLILTGMSRVWQVHLPAIKFADHDSTI